MRAIDVDALLEEIHELPFTMSIYANSKECRTARDTKNRILEVIREAPTLSPDDVRGTGKWIHTFDDIGTYEKCSCCGKEYYCGPIAPFNYCPNCGARMKGVEDKS